MTTSAYKILIIDDDLAFKKMLQLRLKSFMDPICVDSFDRLSTARELLKEKGASSYDLVILDEHLPDGRGVELLSEGWFEGQAVLSISSDNAPEIPGALLQAGATYFLNKVNISEALFKPLVMGIIDRNKIRRELDKAKVDSAIMDSIKTMVSTLRHEINNPLGVVLGAAYLIGKEENATEDQRRAAELVESSGKRIKHVLDKICETFSSPSNHGIGSGMQAVTKSNQKVFHIPGDKPWIDKAEES